jgi:4-amino-4-deoxy-L-arabinose transferase-like glycosyltransferase
MIMQVLHRVPGWLMVLLLGCALALPNLGATSLWDDDEGVNAECTREMVEANTVIIPTFNWDLRTAKPIFLYWVMRASFAVSGETELAARMPSAVAFVLMLLVLYDMARRMFDRTTGLVAAGIAGSTLELTKLGHAATTDSLLILFTVLFFWGLWAFRRLWPLVCGLASALMMLTKGPAVGVVLPLTILLLLMIWNKELRRLRTWWLPVGLIAWVFVAVPWYVLVATETKGEWARAFFFNENLARASEPKENHTGVPVVYEFGMVCLFFAPYSAFLYGTFRNALTGSGSPRSSPSRNAVRLLVVWVVVYFVACAAAATKLPHYIAPSYPALAILTAHFLLQWKRGLAPTAEWVPRAGALGYICMGVIVVGGCLIAGGVFPVNLAKVRVFPGLAWWAWLGLLPLVAGLVMYRTSDRAKFVMLAVLAPVLLASVLTSCAIQPIEARKAVKKLVAESGARQLDTEVRIGRFEYTKPSITFYVGRRVEHLMTPEAAAEFLMFPVPSYLFVTEKDWEEKVLPLVVNRLTSVAARQYDYDRNQDIVVVVNRPR